MKNRRPKQSRRPSPLRPCQRPRPLDSRRCQWHLIQRLRPAATQRRNLRLQVPFWAARDAQRVTLRPSWPAAVTHPTRYCAAQSTRSGTTARIRGTPAHLLLFPRRTPLLGEFTGRGRSGTLPAMGSRRMAVVARRKEETRQELPVAKEPFRWIRTTFISWPRSRMLLVGESTSTRTPLMSVPTAYPPPARSSTHSLHRAPWLAATRNSSSTTTSTRESRHRTTLPLRKQWQRRIAQARLLRDTA